MAVTSPDPHAAGSTRHSQWWVIGQPIQRGGQLLYKVIMATARPNGYAAGPYASQSAAQNWVNKNGGGTTANVGGDLSNLNPFSWLGSLGGMIGSGLESGVISVIKDLWDVVIGPLEVLIGGLIVIAVLVIYFKNDIERVVGYAAGAMAMAG
jgi:hypothetical protein